MNPNRIREAVMFVAAKIRKGESADVALSITGEDVEGWLEDLALTTISKDASLMKKKIREGSRKGGVSIQLAIPGMDHAALPPAVWKKDENGFDVALPVARATKAEIRREVQLNRRVANLIDQVVGGWEATLDRLDELGVSDDELGHEIIERFADRPELEDGDDA